MPVDGDEIRGSSIFQRNCAVCHNLTQNSVHEKNIGPGLGAIYERMAASDVHFDGYTS